MSSFSPTLITASSPYSKENPFYMANNTPGFIPISLLLF